MADDHNMCRKHDSIKNLEKKLTPHLTENIKIRRALNVPNIRTCNFTLLLSSIQS